MGHPRRKPEPVAEQAADKYGARRLGSLYEVGKLLTHFVKTVEETVAALLAIVVKELPLRSAILIEKTSGDPRSVVWSSPAVGAVDRRAAEVRAMRTFAALTGSRAPSAKAGERPEPASGTGKFITCPLIIAGRPIFGALHLEGAEPFDENDAAFASAVAGQLAVALDRFHARIEELARRNEAVESGRRAEREVESRRLAEKKVLELNADLERRVAERTAQLEETIKELHAFTYSIAHDLRAPLRHIHGFGELLSSCKDEADRLKLVDRVLATSESMDGLIRDLLAYSRLTLEAIELEPVSLSAVLKEVRAALKEDLVERKGLLDVEEPLRRVLGHERTLTQAVVNLVSNALKFASPGKAPRVRVRAEDLGGRVRLWVEDDGIGIAPEHLDRIFGVFQRLHRTDEYPGTGIGLAIVRRAMERMKGSAGVESTPGKGSRFWLELDKAPEDA